MPSRFKTSQPDLSQLKAQLMVSGLQQRDNPTFQVINTLIDYLRKTFDILEASITASGSGGTGIAQTIQQLFFEEEDIDSNSIIIPGPKGDIGLSGIPISIILDGIDGEDGFTIPGLKGDTGPIGSSIVLFSENEIEDSFLVSGPSNTPAGLNTQVQFNDNGAFGADAGLVYNKTTDKLTVSGDVEVNGTKLIVPSGDAGILRPD